MNGFKDINFDDQNFSSPEMQKLINYVNAIKSNEMKFEDLPVEYIEKLADLIGRE